jgi:hypothetical protein
MPLKMGTAGTLGTCPDLLGFTRPRVIDQTWESGDTSWPSAVRLTRCPGVPGASPGVETEKSAPLLDVPAVTDIPAEHGNAGAAACSEDGFVVRPFFKCLIPV